MSLSSAIKHGALLSVLIFAGHLALGQAPTGAQILGADARGNGCPPGSVSTSLSPDSQELSILFDQFIAQSGGSSPQPVDKKHCIMDIQFQIPPGYSMALVSADYRGFAALEPGAMAQHEVLYSFNKSFAGSSFSSQTAQGPFNQDYFVRNVMDPSQLQWSPCHQNQVALTVRTSLVTQSGRLPDGRLAAAMVTLDTVDAAVQQNFRVSWRTCSGGGNGGGGRPPVSQKNVSVFQLFDGRDRLLTTDARLVERPGGSWVNQGVAFEIFRQARQIRFPVMLVSCLDDSQGLHFVSGDSRCEGRRMVAQLGFMSSQPESGLVPLYQFINPSNSMHRIQTTRAQEGEQAGFRMDRIIGYVIQTRP